MPRMMDNTMLSGTIPGVHGFGYSGTRIERLGASEYTLVTIAVDITGSVTGFRKELRDMLVAAVLACKKSPRSANLLVRVILFNTSLKGGVEELHGFKPLSDIDPTLYAELNPGGGTPLFDAAFSAIGATNAYAKKLFDSDFFANAILFVITDGEDNASTTTPTMIKKEIERAVKGEELESVVSVLIGINDQYCTPALEAFKRDAGLDQYIAMGDVTRGKLAKLAGFVSRSVSSQSQALGTGGPSTQIPTVI